MCVWTDLEHEGVFLVGHLEGSRLTGFGDEEAEDAGLGFEWFVGGVELQHIATGGLNQSHAALLPLVFAIDVRVVDSQVVDDPLLNDRLVGRAFRAGLRVMPFVIHFRLAILFPPRTLSVR